jgi:acyl-CoA thioester hydrolase
MINLDKYKSRLKIQVRYADLDTYGHVNNKAYLSFLEEARIKYRTQVNGAIDKNLDFEAVVGRIDIKYLAPIMLFDEVWIYTRCSRIGGKSYDLESHIVKIKDEKEIISAIAVVTLVSFDLKTGKTKANPQTMIEKILDYEEEKPIMQ